MLGRLLSDKIVFRSTVVYLTKTRDNGLLTGATMSFKLLISKSDLQLLIKTLNTSNTTTFTKQQQNDISEIIDTLQSINDENDTESLQDLSY
jgi:hypothetical protein